MKLATVLDCDIAGSTPLTTRLGAEGMQDLVRRFLDASAAEVRRFGGTIPQFKGDGFLALFGLPLTHEDHVRRALLAALAIQRAVAEGAGERGGLELAVRIGIDSGSVYYGPIAASLTLDHTVIGEPPIIAVRLQSEAEPGAVLISEDTYRQARDYARVEQKGVLQLKGLARPISAYRLLGVSHRRPGLRESAPARSAAFIDRTAELATLNCLLTQVENGRGQAVGLVGEPGIGKSRILAEFRRLVGDARANWVEGRCLSYGTQIPYMLVLDTLRSNCGILETDTADAITAKLRATLEAVGMSVDDSSAVLLHLLEVKTADSAPVRSNPEAVKGKAFEALRQLCLRASRTKSLILALEDLHWVDRTSEEFLEFLAAEVGDACILLLGTYRPGCRPSWLDRSCASQLEMQPLSQGDSFEIVRSVLQTEQVVELIAREIVAKADGNPLFLEQLSLHAGESTNLPGPLVPNTIREVVMARIDRLSEAAKRALQLAAVIGREFPLRLLQAVWPGPGPVDNALRALVRLEFLDEWPDDEETSFVFRHALTQETAYSSLLERHRRRHHGAVAAALEELYRGRSDEVAELLALHFGRSDDPEKAVDYAIRAAEKAQRRWANTDALAYFEDALSRLDRMPDSDANRLRRIDAVLKQAEIKFALGQHSDHIEALDRIRDRIEQIDDPRRRSAWHYWRGFLHSLTGGRPDIAIDHCNQATLLAGPADVEIKAFAQSCLAQVYTIAGRLRDAVEVGELALASFEAHGNLWWAGRTLWHLSVAANCLGEWDASLNYCRRALDHGIALNDLRLKVVGWLRLGSAHIQQGNLDLGFECCSKALALTPTPYDAAMVRAAHGYAEIKAGNYDIGVAELSEVLAWSERSHLRYTRSHQALWLAEGHIRGGDCAGAKPLVKEVLSTSENMGYLHFEGRARWLLSECLATEAPPRAEHELKRAIDIFKYVGAENDLGKAIMTSARLRRNFDDFKGARQLYAQARDIFRKLGTSDELRRVEAALSEQA